ncbi:MAG: TetR/AcrR family transcriptional regulator, partial [Bacillota bacterium]|nr:TetR/AcrR family transcriptional regulator [Bacillota bacterium]
MTKDKYHHGTLKQDMIHKGLELLNQQGFEAFSLRKVAAMCGVSHTAPYKHFKDKNELIQAIVLEVTEAFANSLREPTVKYPDNPRLQIIEMGKAYVRFMVENPEYMQFLFLADNPDPVRICSSYLPDSKDASFEIFRKSAEYYLDSIHQARELYYVDTLVMWSLV